MMPRNGSLTDGIQYKGMKFDGINDHLRLEDSTKADIAGNEMSIDFWVYFDNFDDGKSYTIVHKESQYSLSVYPGGLITWADSSDWSYTNFGLHNIGLEVGKWQHIAVTKNNGIVKIYLNGSEKISKSFGGGITSTKIGRAHV